MNKANLQKDSLSQRRRQLKKRKSKKKQRTKKGGPRGALGGFSGLKKDTIISGLKKRFSSCNWVKGPLTLLSKNHHLFGLKRQIFTAVTNLLKQDKNASDSEIKLQF